jgi:hypothetical protein
LEEPATGAVADGAGSVEGGVAGEVEFGRVVEEENQRMAAHGLEGLGPVGSLDGVQGGGLLVAQAIERLERTPGEHLGQWLLGVGGDLGSRLDQSLGAASVPQFDIGECF